MSLLIALTLLLAPTYTIRFNLFGLPTNFLMLWVFAVWFYFASWLTAKKQTVEFFLFLKNLDKKILSCILLFLLAGLLSLFVSGIDAKKIAQFVVLFVQPIGTFFVAAYVFQKDPKAKNLLLTTCYLLLGLMGAYAALQYFTLIGLPQAFWGNSQEPKRAISFFVHPNFYALFSAPLLAFLLPDVSQNLKSKILNLKSVLWTCGAIGLFLSLSRAGWLGLATAVGVYAFVAADKKIRKIIFASVIAIAIVVIATPNLRWRLLLPFHGEKSASSRALLWKSGARGIEQSPILGLGLNGYANKYQELIATTTLDTHNFPHNIFLDVWVETGLLGLVSFVGLVSLYIYRGLKNKQNVIALSVSLLLIALIFQGLVDNPYFKNDLAVVFWMVLALSI